MSGSELKANARKLIFEKSPRLLLISLVYVVLVSVVSWLTVQLPGSIRADDILTRLSAGEMPGLGILYTNFRPVGVFLAIILYMIQPILDVGYKSFCLKTSRKQDTEFKDLFNGFLFFTKVISIFIITTVLITLWSMLLFIPGIVALYRYRLAYYILLDDPRKGAMQCINESKLLMNGKKLDLLIIDLSFIGWYFLDVLVMFIIPSPIALPLVSIWLSPYFGITISGFYEDQIAKTAV